MTQYPIIFNALKHHIGFIKTFIEKQDNADLVTELLKIGGSQMDVYVGVYTIEHIFQEICTFLKQKDVFEAEKYEQHLQENGGFIETTLSDNSTWTLLLGVDKEQYIHIHPSRHALHTLRVKAGTLKTAIAFLSLEMEGFSTENINKIRKNLGLSPIKNIEDSQSIKKMVEILRG